MKKPALLALLLWAVPASAAEQPCTLRIDGPVAIITCQLAAPPPVVPPVTPPPVVVVPPVVVPPPVRDPTPFAFPTNCLKRPVFDYERTRFAWRLPGKADDDPGARIYAYEDSTGNPSVGSHQCLGIIKPGAVTETGVPVGNLRAWGPIRAGTESPWQLRCVLETGRLCP